MTTNRPGRPQDVTIDWAAVEELAGHTHQVPSVELQALLARWELLQGIPGAQVERDAVAEKIMDLFASYPDQAPGWQRAWKALHQTANMEAER